MLSISTLCFCVSALIHRPMARLTGPRKAMMVTAMMPPQMMTSQVSVGCSANSTGSSTSSVMRSSSRVRQRPVRNSRILFTSMR